MKKLFLFGLLGLLAALCTAVSSVFLFLIKYVLKIFFKKSNTLHKSGTLGPSVWPQPVSISAPSADKYWTIEPTCGGFTFDTSGSPKCDLITTAIKRYLQDRLFIEDCSKLLGKSNPTKNTDTSFPVDPVTSAHFNKSGSIGLLTNLTISYNGSCLQTPALGDSEQYSLTVDEHGARLVGNSVWGVLRGLETFSQLLRFVGSSQWALGFVQVNDFPRFPHRGKLTNSCF